MEAANSEKADGIGVCHPCGRSALCRGHRRRLHYGREPIRREEVQGVQRLRLIHPMDWMVLVHTGMMSLRARAAVRARVACIWLQEEQVRD